MSMDSINQRCIANLLSVACLLTLTGCGDSDDLAGIHVSGIVTLAGQPVEDGQIRFLPEAGTTSPVVIEAIENGLYTTKGSRGVPPGQYRVEILAFDPAIPTPSSADDPPRRQLLPARYNDRTELRLTVEPDQPATTQNYALTP